jgi:type II secretory pathway component PulC
LLLSNLYTACKIEIAVQIYKLTSRVFLTLTNSNRPFQLASAPSQSTASQSDAGALDESAVQLVKSSAPKSQDQLKSKLSVQ